MEKNSIKIIFFDIDFTLFDHYRNEFSPSAIKAIKKARDKGIKVIICTGRPFPSLRDLDTFKQVPHDGYIATNGGIAFVDNHYLIKEIIDKKYVEQTIEIAKEHNLVLELITPTSSFLLDEENQIVHDFYTNWKEVKPIVKNYEQEEISSMLLFSTKENDKYFQSIPYFYHRFFEGGCDIYRHHYMKSQGVKEVLKYFNIDKKNAMAFGDDVPDIEMFSEVNTSVAMGNSKEEVKDKATYVTTHISKRGVLKALKHFKII